MANEKNYNYFNQFLKLINYSCEASELLSATLKDFNIKRLDEKLQKMHEIEHTADLEKHQIIDKLAKEFITPIEREDILALTEQIDDLTDTIEDVLMSMYMFNINSLRKEIFSFGEIIQKCCFAVKDMLNEFVNFRKSAAIGNLIIEVNSLEGEADKLYVNAVKNLFSMTNDPVEMLKWREIFAGLEKCCDSCEVIANSIEVIIMKNS